MRNMIRQLPGEEGLGEGEMLKVAVLLFGPESPIYRVFCNWIKIFHHKFAHFLATFLCVYRMNQPLNKFQDDDDINAGCSLSSIQLSQFKKDFLWLWISIEVS